MKHKLALYVYVLLLLSTCVYAKNTLYEYKFTDYDEIHRNNTGPFGLDWGKGWWYYNPASYNSIENLDFSKDFWMPIEQWEYQVCSRGLSTELKYTSGAGIGSTWSGIYDDAVTVEALRSEAERNTNDKTYLYQVSWYFHPISKGRYYSVKLYNSATGASKVIQDKTGAGTIKGSSGYTAFYSADYYDKVKLYDESTPKEFMFSVVKAIDSSR